MTVTKPDARQLALVLQSKTNQRATQKKYPQVVDFLEDFLKEVLAESETYHLATFAAKQQTITTLNDLMMTFKTTLEEIKALAHTVEQAKKADGIVGGHGDAPPIEISVEALIKTCDEALGTKS